MIDADTGNIRETTVGIGYYIAPANRCEDFDADFVGDRCADAGKIATALAHIQLAKLASAAWRARDSATLIAGACVIN